MKYKLVKKTIEINGHETQINYAQRIPVMCKKCKNYTRRNGSAYCDLCADEYKRQRETAMSGPAKAL